MQRGTGFSTSTISEIQRLFAQRVSRGGHLLRSVLLSLDSMCHPLVSSVSKKHLRLLQVAFTTPLGCPVVVVAFIITQLQRMSFGLYNAPSTFQRCMLSIFSDLLEECMEVFMDDFTVYADTFEACLEGIVLGHLVSNRGIEVDKAKIDVIISLPKPASVRDVRSFLRHIGFYRWFIRNFSKIVLPLSKLLQKDVDFVFDEACVEALEELKARLTSTPIL
ncbi:Retrovirus-related Pol polyprotein, partial [Mucuna pruriens]